MLHHDGSMLWPIFSWTFKGILCTCRFLWICPYNAIQFLPREKHIIAEKSFPQKQPTGCESKMVAAASIPGCPDRTAALQKRLSKTEQDILSLRTRLACERASWERKFAQLQRKQEALCNQIIFEAGALTRGEQKVDNGDVFALSESRHQDRGSDVSSRGSPLSLSPAPSSTSASSCSSASSVRSGRSLGPLRVFVPHSPMDLHLGHRVRLMLPSGRISTGTVRFVGHLQGESELHLGVELQTPDHGMRDGHHKGRCYFDCKPGYGAFVPFHKLLMAWE